MAEKRSKRQLKSLYSQRGHELNLRLALLPEEAGSVSLSHDREETPTDTPLSPPPPPPPPRPQSPAGHDSDYEELPFAEDEVWDALVHWVQSRPLDDLKMISLVLYELFRQEVGLGIMAASEKSAEIVARTARTIRTWRRDFIDNRGEFSPYMRGKYARPSLISQEDVRTKAAKWARSNACVRGMPNMTLASFAHNLNTNIIPKLNLPYGFPRAISISTASRFLHSLGFRRVSANRKSVYIDGHERPDVLEEREQFLDSIFLLQTTHRQPPLPDDGLPDIAYSIGQK